MYRFIVDIFVLQLNYFPQIINSTGWR